MENQDIHNRDSGNLNWPLKVNIGAYITLQDGNAT